MELLSVVVRCFDGEDLIDDFSLKLQKTLKNYDYEVVLVTDNALDFENSVVSTEKNALFDGLSNANGDLVCFIDIDLCDLLRFIPPMIGLIDKVNKDFDVVMTRKVKEDMVHHLMNKFSKNELFKTELCLMKRSVVSAVLSENTFSQDFLEREGFRIAWYGY